MRVFKSKIGVILLTAILSVIVLVGCQRTPAPLTMERLQTLSQKGESLSWRDFEPYVGEDIGSGLYILKYDIDEEYFLLVGGGSKEGTPLYIHLVQASDTARYIDIRTEPIADFIG